MRAVVLKQRMSHVPLKDKDVKFNVKYYVACIYLYIFLLVGFVIF